MKLVDGIRRARNQEKMKKPLPRSVWAVVAAIVKEYGLEGIPPEAPFETEPLRRRVLAPLSLFPLVTPAQMHLCKEILEKFSNPYLVYARSPEDFRASQLLYSRRPDLPAEVFRECSPKEVLLRESVAHCKSYPQEG